MMDSSLIIQPVARTAWLTQETKLTQQDEMVNLATACNCRSFCKWHFETRNCNLKLETVPMHYCAVKKHRVVSSYVFKNKALPVSREPEAHLDAVAGIHNFGRMRDTPNRPLIFHHLTAAPVPAAPSAALYLLTPLLTHSPAVQLAPTEVTSSHHRISPFCPVGLQLHGQQYTAGRLRDA